jgi:NADPH:quinone reductase
MRQVRVHEFGSPEVLRVEQVAPPRASEGQLLIAVEVAGVIYGDTIVRSGRYPLELPWSPGTEVGGQVVSVGDGVDSTWVGRTVVATTSGNRAGYAEFALAEVLDTFAVPAGLPLDQAVAVFQAGALSIGILTAMKVRADDCILITAAGGRIGSLLVQLAKAGGATVIGAAGSAHKLDAITELGADMTVDYTQADWVAAVKDMTGGRGADVVVDAIGGIVGDAALDAIVAGTGRFGLYGLASGSWVSLDAERIARRGLTVMAPLGITFAKAAHEQRTDSASALAAAVRGNLTARIHAMYPLERSADAHADLEQRRNVGAVVLKPCESADR